MKLISSIAMPAWVAGLKVITSRCESCHKSLALRHLSTRKAGIRMHGNWYCSSRCFQSATEQEVLRLLKPGTELPARVERMPLGLSLISHGFLTIEQLKKATDEQKEVGGGSGRTPGASKLGQRKAGNCRPCHGMGVSRICRTEACVQNWD